MKKVKAPKTERPVLRPADIFKPPEFSIGDRVKLLDTISDDTYIIADIGRDYFFGYIYFLNPTPVAHSAMQLSQNLSLLCEAEAAI